MLFEYVLIMDHLDFNTALRSVRISHKTKFRTTYQYLISHRDYR
ncbi:hypothetical protein BN863_630 [Formosa agariphila KMM 3901]|uniref:Uncharacterized protein n=1 Tax=Formosa agariphila (strain DSM 15362 / KCTC 12365 / LMG 23005 / KMM 3901 / M-2Alg 35-1) TaxID=1347342 RepID=T2KGB9_FORAG|nr:hypothetical protein BN863_630 [Formosa agariphila KMM 3901]